MPRAKLLIWLLVGAAACIVAFAPLPFSFDSPEVRNFRVEASQYAYTPAELMVNPGDRVIIELVATDVVHGLFIDGYGVSVVADPGQSARLEFIADRSGSFRLRCNVTCGAMHPFMIGKLHVGQNTLLWRGMGLAGLAVIAMVARLFFQSSPPKLVVLQ